MKIFKKFVVIIKISFSNAIAYRVSTVAKFLFYALFIYVFLSLWRAIYREGSVHGFDFAQIVWYLIMTEFITFCCETGILNIINEDVKSGAIAYQLGDRKSVV